MKRFLRWLRVVVVRALNLPEVGQLRVATGPIFLKRWSPPNSDGIIMPGVAFTIIDGVTHFPGIKGIEYISYQVIVSNEQVGAVTDYHIKRFSSIVQESL